MRFVHLIGAKERNSTKMTLKSSKCSNDLQINNLILTIFYNSLGHLSILANYPFLTIIYNVLAWLRAFLPKPLINWHMLISLLILLTLLTKLSIFVMDFKILNLLLTLNKKKDVKLLLFNKLLFKSLGKMKKKVSPILAKGFLAVSQPSKQTSH